jgi:hypothetical protein
MLNDNTGSWEVILWLIRYPCTAGWISVDSLAYAYIITVHDMYTEFRLAQNFTSA